MDLMCSDSDGTEGKGRGARKKWSKKILIGRLKR